MSELAFLTGRTTDQLIPFLNSQHLVHREMNQNLMNLFIAANKAGFELSISSTFRSYEAQKTIWNEKCLGLRQVLDSNSKPINLMDKSNLEKLFLILRWSAIPGGSRHHWGSDLDIYDQKAISSDYKVQLIPSEYEKHGPFYPLTLWLNENMEEFGFYRPYSVDHGGIAPEPWHLSYRVLSDYFLQQFTYQRFVEHLNISDFLFYEIAEKNSFEIYQRFINLK